MMTVGVAEITFKIEAKAALFGGRYLATLRLTCEDDVEEHVVGFGGGYETEAEAESVADWIGLKVAARMIGRGARCIE